MSDQRSYTFFSYAFFAFMLGMAGLPITFMRQSSCGQLRHQSGCSWCRSLALRLPDFVQDPLLGRLAERTLNLRSLPIWHGDGAWNVWAFSMEALFRRSFGFLTLAAVFSGFSFDDPVLCKWRDALCAKVSCIWHDGESGNLLGFVWRNAYPFN